jgi:hypothetical protein
LDEQLTLLQVRKLPAHLIEDFYHLRGESVPAFVANKLEASGPSALGGAYDLLTGAAKSPPASPVPSQASLAPTVDDLPPVGIARVQKAKDPKVTKVFTKPSSRTSTTIRFKMDDYDGVEIKPGERWLFEVPPDLRGAKVRTAVLAHRKDYQYEHTFSGGRDSQGAYNLVSARKSGEDKWVTWSDQYGSKKFAELRDADDPEHENLHDWLYYVGDVSLDLLSVTNVGHGKSAIANVHLLEIEFFPTGKHESFQEEIFTPGTSFIRPEKGWKKPLYGGGNGGHLSREVLKKEGMYPKSVEIGSYGDRKISKDSYVDDSGRLHIRLPPGKRFGSFEISCGDTTYDRSQSPEEQRNKDGHYGGLGFAKLCARLENRALREKYDWDYDQPLNFMHRINVPPAGVLSGGPIEPGYVTKPGDEIVVESEDHETWVMGYRIQFMADESDASSSTPSISPKD